LKPWKCITDINNHYSRCGGQATTATTDLTNLD